MSKDSNSTNPSWVPSWFPDKVTIDYISGGLTAILLLLVGSYLALHFFKGGTGAKGATIAAGVGVGGAGT
jgi:hypothetical protein